MLPFRLSFIYSSLSYMSLMYFIPIFILLKKSQAFEVNIFAGSNVESSSVSVSGTDEHFITDIERQTFGLTDEYLFGALETYRGARPDEVFVGSPPWINTFQESHRRPVKTVLTAQRAEILNFTKSPLLIAHERFDNSESSQKATFTADMSSEKQISAENNWSETNSISATQTIEYGLSFLGTGGGGETSFGYTHEWGTGGSETTSITIGTSSGVEIELEPGSSSVAILTANQAIMKVKVYFQASLIDGVFYHYYGTFEDHYYWVTDINNLGTFTREITQDIDITYYIQSTVQVIDADKYDEIFTSSNLIQSAEEQTMENIENILGEEEEPIPPENEPKGTFENIPPEIQAQIFGLLQTEPDQVQPLP